MEVRSRVEFEAPDLPPVVLCEQTAQGWRGLTADGEVLNATAPNGAAIPSSIAITHNGQTLGYRAVPPPQNDGAIGRYIWHFDRASALVRSNDPAAALAEIEAALAIAPTDTARFNRGMILLHLGRWPEGFDEYQHCEHLSSFLRPKSRAAMDCGLTRWQGQDIAGKRLLLIHDHGFGDTIMNLRFVPRLKAMGADVVLVMPPELRRLAAQCGPVVAELEDADYFCSMLALLHVLRLSPDDIPTAPYLAVDRDLVEKWRPYLNTLRRQIGIAWSVGAPSAADYQRSIPLGVMTRALAGEGDLISVQQQGGDEASRLGVEHFQFEDFADCAALMSLLDEIVTVDTAALHLAGATGHPKVTAMLSHWSSWRWLSPLYQNVRFCKQTTDRDWESAFAQR